jgi:ferredoxin
VTPWGLRAKLRGAIGGIVGGRGGGSGEVETVALRLVLPGGQEHEVRCEPRYTLVMASQTLDTPIATGCPDGQCGGCNVDVLEGSDSLLPASPAEQRLLAEKHASRANARLACHAKVVASGAKVKVHSVWSIDSTRGE